MLRGKVSGSVALAFIMAAEISHNNLTGKRRRGTYRFITKKKG